MTYYDVASRVRDVHAGDDLRPPVLIGLPPFHVHYLLATLAFADLSSSTSREPFVSCIILCVENIGKSVPTIHCSPNSSEIIVYL